MKKTSLSLPVCMGAILLVWVWLYLPDLAQSPAYYVDEGYSVDLAKGIYEGRLGGSSYERPLAPYMPLHRAFVAGFLSWDDPILGARLLSTFCALAVALFLFLSSRPTCGPWLAAGFAGIFLTYSQSIVLFRMGYPHAMFSIGVLLLFFSYRAPWWKPFLGGLLCFWSHLFALPALACAGALHLLRPVRLLLIALTVGLCLAGYAVLVSLLGGAGWLAEDLGLNAEIFRGDVAFNPGNRILIFFHYHFQDLFHITAFVCAVFGLCRRELTSWGYLLLGGILVLQRQNILIFNYPEMMLLPLAVKCMADTCEWAIFRSEKRDHGSRQVFDRRTAAGLLVSGLFFLQAGGAWLQSIGPLLPRHEPRFQTWATSSMEELWSVANFVNVRTGPEDLVLANPVMGSLLHARSTDWLTGTLYLGHPTTFVEQGWPAERFPFPLDPDEYRFVIVSDADRVWTLHQPNVEKLKSRFSRWPVIFSVGDFSVRQNPRSASEEPKP